jgi:hypothetical protein
MDHKLDLTLSYGKATGKDLCVLCGDPIVKMGYMISSNRTKGSSLMLLFDEPCIEQIATLSIKALSEINKPTNERELN